jgi:glutamate synthase (NADPH/NADH) small chain
LTQQTKSLYGEEIPNQILATGKDVLLLVVEIQVLTVGTSNRQGAKFTISRSCLNHLLDEAKLHPALLVLKTSLHIRKVVRNWLINTKEFISNEKGELVGLKP